MDYLLQLKNVIYKLIHDTLWLLINNNPQMFSNRLPSMCVVNKENIVSLLYVLIHVEQNWKLNQPK